MVFDATISLGTLLQTGVIVGGSVALIISVKNKVEGLGKDVVDLKTDVKKLNEVIVTMAVQSNRISNLEEDIRELKRNQKNLS